MSIPTTAQLEQALAIRQQIENLESQLRMLFNRAPFRQTPAPRRMMAASRPKQKRSGGGLTAAGRRRLSENMKARWAARRK